MRWPALLGPPSTGAQGRVAAAMAEAESGRLPRTLGRLDLVVLGVGAMVGGGVFILTGLVAAHEAGPAVVLAYLLAAAVCAIAALCYAELAAMMPVAGSAYSYAYVSMGELGGWLFGWLLVLEYALGAALVALGWAEYGLSFVRSLGVAGTALPSVPLLAALGILAAGGLLVLGVRPSAYAAGVLVLVKVGAIALFVAFGAAFVSPRNWLPFVPPPAGGAFGWAGVGRAAALVFFAYAGFDAVATAAQEARSPRRDLPAGILGALGIATLLYASVGLVLTGLIPYRRLGASALGDALGATGLGWVRFLVDVAVLAGLASVLLVLLLAQARVLFAMARDRLLPGVVARVHPRFGTPWLATLVTTGVVALAAALVSLRALGEVVSAAVLVSYGGVCLGVVLLRRAAPGVSRPFRVAASPALPLAGAAACGALLLVLPRSAWAQLAGWLALGAAVYGARRVLGGRAVRRPIGRRTGEG